MPYWQLFKNHYFLRSFQWRHADNCNMHDVAILKPIPKFDTKHENKYRKNAHKSNEISMAILIFQLNSYSFIPNLYITEQYPRQIAQLH